MAFVEDDLWSHVLRSPAERPCLFAHGDLLGKTKIHLKDKRTVSEGFFVFFCRSALTMNMRCLLTTTTEEHSQCEHTSRFTHYILSLSLSLYILQPVFSDKTWTNQFGVSVAVQDEVFRFQVSVYDAFGVQVGEGFDHTASVKASG